MEQEITSSGGEHPGMEPENTMQASTSSGAGGSPGGGLQPPARAMNIHLLDAASGDDYTSIHDMVLQDPTILLEKTRQGNNCLHIASIHGHLRFCRDVLRTDDALLSLSADVLKDLLSDGNSDMETPLVVAITRGHVPLASFLLSRCCQLGSEEGILRKDGDGCNALHHAIRSGHKDLALELIEACPALSRAVSENGESPMFVAVMRDLTEVSKRLIKIPDYAYAGKYGRHALHAAAINGNQVVARELMERRPGLATETDTNGDSPIKMAVLYNKVDVLRVLLRYDSSLGYGIDGRGYPLLCCAADQGQVDVARELLKHCPDALYRSVKDQNRTCLHIAAQKGHREFVEFILRTPQLQKLGNMQDSQGKTALHYAVHKCDPKLVAALLSHKYIDTTMLDNDGNSAASQLPSITDKDKDKDKVKDKILKEVHVLMLNSNTPTGTSSSGGGIDRRLLQAATSGDSTSMKHYAYHDPSILLGTTPSGNTCLHIPSVHGHGRFCKDVLKLEESLLTAVNSDKETPLVSAVRSGHASLASALLGYYRSRQSSDAILQQDKDGCNALHHAIRSGHKELALELIAAEPALSKGVNKYNESPMFIAAIRNSTVIFRELLNIPYSSHVGPNYQTALHAAVRNGDKDSATKIITVRPEVAGAADKNETTPARLAVHLNKTDLLRVLLRHDCSLGYEVTKKGHPLLSSAAFRGHVDVAREILNNCPDAPYCTVDVMRWTCLHIAILHNHLEFVEFILMTPQLRKLLNMQNNKGETALHFAVEKCNPKIVAALLSHADIDLTIVDEDCNLAAWRLRRTTDQAKTLNWNEVSMRMLRAVPQQDNCDYNLHKVTKQQATAASRKDARSLTQTYTSNTSLVAILIATITFAAAFTLPGGYSSDAGNEGLPIMSKKFAFQAFLISDVLAMCSSFAVAFICIIARWEDYEFLLYYRSFTKKLMWFAYTATTTAFSTGLYTVLAPRLHWLAIAICVLVASLPIITWLLGKWPVLKLRIRLGKTFNSDLLDMV